MRLRSWGDSPWRRSSFPLVATIPHTPDVAIIGGGLTGTSAAWHLATRGIKVALFEADCVGSGASGRTGGLVLEGLAYGPRPGALDCVPRLKQLVDDLRIDCDLHLPGCWEIEHQNGDWSHPLPWQDAGAGIVIVRTVPGGIVEPAALTIGIAEAAHNAGAVICEGSRVDRLTVGEPPKLEVRREVVTPGQVIIALNGWTTAFVPVPETVSALTYACSTEPLDRQTLATIGLAERIPFYTVDTPYLWGRVSANGAVVFGAGLTYGSPDEMEATTIDDVEPRAILDRLEARVHGLHPALAHVRITSRWAGPIAFRKGAIPVLTRHPQSERVLVAGAYAGHGVAFSVHAGALMAAAIVDNTPLPSWGALGANGRNVH